MYKQTVQRRQRNPVVSILLILFMVAAIYAVASFVSFAALRLGFAWAQYVVYILLIFLALYIVRNWLTSFHYALSETELLLEKLIGNRVRQREVIKLSGVMAYAWYAKNARKHETLQFAYKPYSAAKLLTVREGGEDYSIVISPNAEMDKRLKALLSIENEDGI